MLCGKGLNLSLQISQIIFYVFGIWRPDRLSGCLKHLFNIYSFISMMSLIGTYIIVQLGDLVQVWGNVAYMTGTMFLLLTNLALITKVLNVMWRKKVIQDMIAESYQELYAERRSNGWKIINSCDRETTRQFGVYFGLSMLTISAWAASAEDNQLPFRAWYPYDTTKTPAYQMTYAHQCVALYLAAIVNICLDTLVTSLASLCRCRLRLLCLSLATLCDGLDLADDGRLTAASDQVVSGRLRDCVLRHQAVLAQIKLLQNCFSMSLLAQFSVSMIIICVTAYQLAFESSSLVRLISMAEYLAVMMLQAFIYCYQGNQLVDESSAVSEAAYQCPWYQCSHSARRALLLMMSRTCLTTKLTAGGFTELSLATFMSIIKASYTFFTVLKQVGET